MPAATSVMCTVTGYGLPFTYAMANVIYARLRAQRPKAMDLEKSIAFICGFPLTLSSFACVQPASQQAWGFHVPLPQTTCTNCTTKE